MSSKMVPDTERHGSPEKTPSEQDRQRNRERYPSVAIFVDEARRYFPDAKVVSIRKMEIRDFLRRKADLRAQEKPKR